MEPKTIHTYHFWDQAPTNPSKTHQVLESEERDRQHYSGTKLL